MIHRVADLAERVLLGNLTTIQATYQIAQAAIDSMIPGDFVECGVFAGAQSAAMARAIMDRHWAVRKVHLFDSFQGIPEPGEHDGNLKQTGVKAGDACRALHLVQGYMREWNISESVLVYHPGWFADTLPLVAETGPKQIAVLRLDADLYESTRLCMQYLYPLVSPGGWVIVDDYNLDGCRKALHEYVMPAPVYFRKD